MKFYLVKICVSQSASADSGRNSTHRGFYEVKINVSVSIMEILVISSIFDISFKFAVEMRKIGTPLRHGGSGRQFEAILCWSFFSVASMCLYGSIFTQISPVRKCGTCQARIVFTKITCHLCFSQKKHMASSLMFEGENWICLYRNIKRYLSQ